RRTFPRGHVWLEAHGAALAAEVMRDSGRRTAAAVAARRVADAYRALGGMGGVRRMELAEWVAGSPTSSTPPFLASWKADGYSLEVAELETWLELKYLPLQQWFVP